MLEDEIEAAIEAELERQADERRGELQVRRDERGFTVQGRIDLQALATAVAGAVAGGP